MFYNVRGDLTLNYHLSITELGQLQGADLLESLIRFVFYRYHWRVFSFEQYNYTVRSFSRILVRQIN